jgi:hypothetical protein
MTQKHLQQLKALVDQVRIQLRKRDEGTEEEHQALADLRAAVQGEMAAPFNLRFWAGPHETPCLRLVCEISEEGRVCKFRVEALDDTTQRGREAAGKAAYHIGKGLLETGKEVLEASS